MRALGLDVRGDERRQFPERARSDIGRKIGRLDGGIRPAAKVRAIGVVDPEEVGDDHEREGCREVGHEVDLLVARNVV